MSLPKSPFLLYLLAILALIVLVVVTEFWIERAEFAEALSDDLSKFQEQQVTVFLAVEALLTGRTTICTLSSSLFSGFG